VAARVHGEAPAAAGETRYQGLATRGIAFAIDAAIIDLVAIIVAAGVGLALSVLSVPGEVKTILVALGGVLWIVWWVGYLVTFWSTTGQTPGNRLMRIQVRRAEGGDEPLSPRRALLRVIFLMLAAIPLLAGFLPILVDARRRGLHDMLAGTVVVEAAEATRPQAAPDAAGR
jgi:uncharacterized RDD family membrane protein YckC